MKLCLLRYTFILAFYEVAFVVLDRKDCALIGLRQTVGVFAIITMCLQLYLLWGQVLFYDFFALCLKAQCQISIIKLLLSLSSVLYTCFFLPFT
jgi:hypothetical protein